MHASNKTASEDKEEDDVFSRRPLYVVAPVVTSWTVAGQQVVFLHMYLQTRVTLRAFPIATPRDAVSKFPWRGTEVANNFLQLLLIFIMNKNLPLHPNSSYYQMCISKKQKSYIIFINIMRQPKHVSWFETISLIRTCRNIFFLFRYLFC